MVNEKIEPKQGLMELVAKAAIDVEFRTKLMADPQSFARKHDLSKLDSVALSKLRKEDLDIAAKNINNRMDWGIGIGIVIEF